MVDIGFSEEALVSRRFHMYMFVRIYRLFTYIYILYIYTYVCFPLHEDPEARVKLALHIHRSKGSELHMTDASPKSQSYCANSRQSFLLQKLYSRHA